MALKISYDFAVVSFFSLSFASRITFNVVFHQNLDGRIQKKEYYFSTVHLDHETVYIMPRLLRIYRQPFRSEYFCVRRKCNEFYKLEFPVEEDN
jgi:hypothetical protein